MTAIAAWLNLEEKGVPRIWAVADSRLSKPGPQGESIKLTDSAVKIFAIPIIIKKPGEKGFFSDIYFEQQIGLCYSGSSIVALNLYATITPLLSNLIGGGSVPSLYDFAVVISKVVEKYTRSLGENTGPKTSPFVESLVIGYCFIEKRLKIFRLKPVIDSGSFRIEIIDEQLNENNIVVIGDKTNEIKKLIEEKKGELEKLGLEWWRSPRTVLSSLIETSRFDSIGGNLQLGIAHEPDFRVFSLCLPIKPGEPEATIKFLNLDYFDDLGDVGGCHIGTPTMS